MIFIKRKAEESSSANDWLNTYADMVTLVLTFFIMLFSTSSVEESKWKEIVESFTKDGSKPSQIVTDPGSGENIAGNKPSESEDAKKNEINDFNDLYEHLKQYIEENNQQSSIEIAKDGDNVFLRLTDQIFFNPDSAVLLKQAEPILNVIGDAMKSIEDKISLVSVNGHTAAVLNYNPTIDRVLSAERATNVLVHFEKNQKFDPKKLQAVGFGNNYPVASNDNSNEKKKNRRVEILIMGKNSEYNNIKNIQDTINEKFK